MPTTNLGIYYPDEDTNITPLQTVLGAMSSSVDAYLSDNATIHTIPNVGARTALVSLYGPTASKPLFTWRQDAVANQNLEYTTDGTTWASYNSGARWYSTTGARDTAIPSPTSGQMASTGTGTSQILWMYSGSAWVAVWTAPTSTSLDTLFVAGTPWTPVTAYKNGSKEVSLEGGWYMAAGTSPVTPAIAYNTATTLLTLPSGYRPARSIDFITGSFSAIGLIVANIRISTAGVVQVNVNNNITSASGSVSPTTGATFSLAPVRFTAA